MNKTSADAPLRDVARGRGLRFGTAVGVPGSISDPAARLPEAAYLAMVARECSLVVPENELKWQALRPAPGLFRFEPADRLSAWATSQGLALRGHTLLWHLPRWWPAWINEHPFGARPAAEAERLLAEHIATVCGRYGGSIGSWDVVNESIDPATGTWHDNALTPHLGNAGQVELAFRLAHEYAPHAQLVYNDFMGWGSHSALHRAGVLRLLEGLKARGAPVHALGLQSHIGTGADGVGVRSGGANDREWRRFLAEVTGMGLDLLVTELDVNDRYLPADVMLRDREAAALLRDYLDVTLDNPHVHDVLAWGLADHLSWMRTWWPRADGLPKRASAYDALLQPKPMRAAIAAALGAAPPRQPNRWGPTAG